MADKRISDLVVRSSGALRAADLFPIEDTNVSDNFGVRIDSVRQGRTNFSTVHDALAYSGFYDKLEIATNGYGAAGDGGGGALYYDSSATGVPNDGTIFLPDDNRSTATSENIGTGDGTQTAFTVGNKPVAPGGLVTGDPNNDVPFVQVVATIGGTSETFTGDGLGSLGGNNSHTATIDYSTGQVTFGTAPDNGASVTATYDYASSSGRMIRASDAVTVQDYGAIGDNTSDDYVAIARADDNDDVVFSGGTYLCNQDLTISSDVVVRQDAQLMAGSGAKVTIEGEISAPDTIPFLGGAGTLELTTTGRVSANWFLGNGSSATVNSDYAQRWNAAWQSATSARRIDAYGDHTLSSPVDMTSYVGPELRVADFHGGKYTWDHTQDVVIDRTGARNLTLQNGRFVYDGSVSNKVGVLLARDSTDTGIGPHMLEKFEISGQFEICTVLMSSAERSYFRVCDIRNDYYDSGDSTGRAAMILTDRDAGSVASTLGTTISSPHDTLTTNRNSANGYFIEECNITSQNGDDGGITGSSLKRSTICMESVGIFHMIGSNNMDCNGYSAINIDVTRGFCHNIDLQGLWQEAYAGTPGGSPDHIVSVHGGDSALYVNNFKLEYDYGEPDVEALHIDRIKEVRNVRFIGAWNRNNTNNHGVLVTERTNGSTQLKGVNFTAGRGASIDFSDLTRGASQVYGTVLVHSEADYVGPGGSAGQSLQIQSPTGQRVTETVSDFPSGDTTPDVSTGSFFRENNSSATTITDFDGVDDEGYEFNLIFNTTNTTIDFTNTNLFGNGGAAFTPSSKFARINCKHYDGKWFCLVEDA